MALTPGDRLVDDFSAAVARTLSLVRVSLPHLSGLAHTVRIRPDARVSTAGVFASGRLVVNPTWFSNLSEPERAFVIGHELLHLALGSHQRGVGADAVQFNLAHDLIINDILEQELGMPPPGGGVRLPGSRHRSVEALMLSDDLPRGRPFGRDLGGRNDRDQVATSVGAALTAALDAAGTQAVDLGMGPSDLLSDRLEQTWYPDEDRHGRSEARETVARQAAHAVATRMVQRATGQSVAALASQRPDPSWGRETGSASIYVDALLTSYRPPWELAVHRWIDTVSEARRTYSRASRRGADRTDVCLPGRARDGRTLSIVFDTSGSMRWLTSHALGSIMTFARGARIETVRLVQCDSSVTVDEVVDIDDLANYEIFGLGGSDMTPAMNHLSHDPDVTAVVVITDGLIVYPDEPMPYHVLWVVYSSTGDDFDPPYGQVVTVHPGDAATSG